MAGKISVKPNHFNRPSEGGHNDESLKSQDLVHQVDAEQCRLLLESAKDYAIFKLDTEGRVASWNQGAARLLGYEDTEIIGQDFSVIFTPEDRDQGLPNQEIQLAVEKTRVEDVHRQVRKGGEQFQANGVLIRLSDEEGNLRGFAKILHDRTECKSVEGERERAEDKRETAEGERRGAEDVRERKSSGSEHVEDERRVAEEERRGAESERTEAESERHGAENERRGAESERKAAEAARAASEDDLRMLTFRGSQFRAILDSMTIGVVIGDLRGSVLTMNPAALKIFGYENVDGIRGYSQEQAQETMEVRDLAGRIVPIVEWPLTRVLRGEWFVDYDLQIRWLDTGKAAFLRHAGTLAYGIDGEPLVAVLTVRDITDFKAQQEEIEARAEREALINRIGQAIRESSDPSEIKIAAVNALGKALGADRCYFANIDMDRGAVKFERDWHRSDLFSLEGDYPLSLFNVDVAELFGSDRAVAVADTRMGPWSDLTVAVLQKLRIRSAISVPLWDNGRLIAVLAVAMADEPRSWTPDEIELAEQVSAQTRSSVGEAYRLAELRASAEREALINKIGQAIRGSSDPIVIQQMAVTLVGQALQADRCYFATYDLVNNSINVAPDWHRPDLRPLAGTYRLSEYEALLHETFGVDISAAIEDILTSPLSTGSVTILQLANMRSILCITLYDNGAVTARFILSMADAPRTWSPDEISLVEAVSVQTRSAVETAFIRERERNISNQLQEALQPAIPQLIPGLALKPYYRAALGEAGVGGDFCDVFSIKPGVHAIVVGDLSGKGLAAAAQVATVRNMLRYALYDMDRTIAESVTKLNRVLAENNLLSQFATLFAGIYDEASCTLTYVNCGQEPGLLRCYATGAITQLPPTGPILGAFEDAEFGEEVVKLASRDILALFTDGLTEVGPNRKDFLEISGVESLLEKHITKECLWEPGYNIIQSADLLISGLISSIEEYSHGSVRDDICLLLGIVGDSGIA